jgi:predicted ester cyclase
MFDTFANDTLTPLRRYHGPNFFVDESLFEGDIVGEFMGMPGRNRRITFRLVHICEIRDGRISRESVWMDSAAVIAQLSA